MEQTQLDLTFLKYIGNRKLKLRTGKDEGDQTEHTAK